MENIGDFFGQEQGIGRECDHSRGGACAGIRMVKEGSEDVAAGLVEIEKAKRNVEKAICEVEKALRDLKCCRKELDNAGCHEKEGLKDINKGIHLVEHELKKPIHLPPICG